MHRVRHLLARIAGVFGRRRLEAEMAEEMRQHLERRTQEKIDEGLSPEEARYAAQREFGGIAQVQEQCREERSRGFTWLVHFAQDLRYAARSLRRNPGFTTVVVLTLALGIGANTTVFSVVHAVLFQPPPFVEPDRLVSVRETRPEAGSTGRRVDVPVSPATFFDYRRDVGSFAQIAALCGNDFVQTGEGEPEQLPGAWVTANFFSSLGVVPRLGRDFRPEEDRPGAAPVALLSDGLWRRRFGRDETVIGQVITLDGRPHTIVGVLPPALDSTALGFGRVPPQIWVPLTLVQAGAARAAPYLNVHARLKPEVGLATAQAEIDAVMKRLAQEFPKTNATRGALVQPLAERAVGEVRATLWLVFAAVGLVQLIACANIANLLLARATRRSAESALRAALGASRSRLIRQFLTESLLLAVAGCAAGLLAAFAGAKAFVAALPATVPGIERIAIDGPVLAFTAGVALLTGVFFGLAPAWQGAKADLQAALQTAGRSGQDGGSRMRAALVVVQVALSLVLLAGAGLVVRSFIALSRVDPGFDPRHVTTLRINLNGDAYRPPEKQIAFFEQLLPQIQALPGVEAAATVYPLPFSPAILNRPFTLPGQPVDPKNPLAAQFNIVSPDYFRALAIRMTQGRAFTERDRKDAPLVAIINESTARRIWPGENPIGKRISVGMDGRRPAEREIVGVFADIRQRQLDGDSRLQICVPSAQEPWRSAYLVMRSAGAAVPLTAIQRSLAALDPNLPISDVAPLTERVTDSIAQRRFATGLLGAFAGIALLLAVLGLYGVMSYLVAQRTREFGIRTALGAKARDLLRLVVGQGMRLVLIGLVLGAVGALGLARVISGFLFGVQPTDPATFAAVSLLLAGVSAVACWLPARRAAKADPLVALRCE